MAVSSAQCVSQQDPKHTNWTNLLAIPALKAPMIRSILHQFPISSFYCTAAMQARSFYEHVSVCLSVKRVHCDKTKQISADILIPYERAIHLVFRHEEWLVGTSRSTWNFGPNWPHRFKNGDFQSIFARSASVLAKKRGIKKAKWPFFVQKWIYRVNDQRY